MTPTERRRTGTEFRIQIQDQTVKFMAPEATPVETALHLPWEAVRAGLMVLEGADPPLEIGRCLGATLFEALVPRESRGLLADRWRVAQERNERLRIRIEHDDAALGALPFEALYAEAVGGWMATSERVSLARRPLRWSRHDLHQTWRRLRVLVLAPRPHDVPPISVDREIETIRGALHEGLASGQVEMCVLTDGQASREALIVALRSEPWHMLHILAHGRWSPDNRRVELGLQRANGAPDWIEERDLEEVLRDCCPRTVILNACMTGASGPHVLETRSAAQWLREAQGAGLATAALRAGAQAVVAMQGRVADRHAVDFAQRFYHELAMGCPVELATSRARQFLYASLRDDRQRFRMLALTSLFLASSEGDRFYLGDAGGGRA